MGLTGGGLQVQPVVSRGWELGMGDRPAASVTGLPAGGQSSSSLSVSDERGWGPGGNASLPN